MELEKTRSSLAALGFGLCSISYDSVAILREFAARRSISFPMLADPDSTIIRRFGLFNEDVQPGSRDHGMAHPGIFLVDALGVVRNRFAEQRYYHRMTMPSVLWQLGAATAIEQETANRDHVQVGTSAPQTSVHPGSRVTLIVDLRLDPTVHIYGSEIGGGYQGLIVSIDSQPWLTVYPARYPPAGPLTLPWTDEILTGYSGPIRVEIDVALGTRQELAALLEAGQGITVTGICRLQACNDQICWPPESIPFQWHFSLTAPDLVRVSETLQHKAAG